MNNLKTIRDFFNLSLTQVSETIQMPKATLIAFEDGTKVPDTDDWQRLAIFYADHFQVSAVQDHVMPIHFRLSVDYLMNIGLTINDLMAFKWYFENTRSELGDFSITLNDVNDGHVERRTTVLADVIEQFAGYLLLNNDGTMNQFIDENNDNHVSDWRLVLYKKDNLIIDVTDQLLYFDYLVNYSIM
ncbi:helix-turn-helix transcriptional regulator [Weissella diestrammenae]|uniref:Helix-turn-helix transcriptional regulator n=1 Tax=Weissella diestrammenae TaxID=1162633 RepID=A0A7G9T3V9_9LACO|nr:helix-turn-helix transcriptional regulator [Weissella diestrammenae]MCM0582108.1 helix-turn-helix transcriptional regulator [Weissella diestrammenae]QNN74784.1 helix-turn-helix transcriptional regulator [Weissella diestrammenae]